MAVAVEGKIEVFWEETLGIVSQLDGVETVGKKRIVGMMVTEPIEDLGCLWVEEKLTAFKSHGSIGTNTLALHHLHDVVEGKMLMRLFPNGTMATT